MALGQSRLPKALHSWSARAWAWLRSCASNREHLPKNQKISLLALIIVVGFSIAVAYHYVMGQYFNKGWPVDTFLFIPRDRFFDFILVVRQSATLDPFGVDTGGFVGSPFGQFVGYLFSLVQPASLRLPIFLGFFFLVFIAMVKHYLYGLKTRLSPHRWIAPFALVFLTYPVLFALDRANFDLLVLPLLLLFVFTYSRGKHRLSAAFLGLAIALKPYTAVFVIVYILDKRFKDAVLAAGAALFLSVLSLSLFKDGFFVETQKYLEALSNLASDPSFGSDLMFTSDLFSLLTVGTRFIGDALNLGIIYLPEHPNVRLAYVILAAVVAIHLVIHLWEKPRPLWKTTAVLTILIILLPITTHDYRLIYLFVPMLIYLATNDTSRNDLFIVVLLGLLLVPKNYYRLESAQNIGMVVNPLLLIGLLVSIVPDAFSVRSVVSTFRFACGRLRSIIPGGHHAKVNDS